MKEKLTLSIEKTLLEKAKRYSKRKGKSLSQMFEDWTMDTLKKESPPAKKSDFVASFKVLWPDIEDGDKVDIESIKRKRIKDKYGI